MMFKSVALNQTVANVFGVGENRKMTDEIRDIGIFAATGILVAVLIIAGVVAGGIRFPSLKLPGIVYNRGTLIVKLTDAPVQLEHLNVTITSLSIHKAMDDQEAWVDLAPPFVNGKQNVSVDLLELVNVTRDIAKVDIDPGNYTKIRIGIEEAKAKYEGAEDWEVVRVPPGKDPPAHIDVIVHFEIEDDEEVMLLIDVTAEWIAISNSGNLRPVLKAEATVVSGD